VNEECEKKNLEIEEYNNTVIILRKQIVMQGNKLKDIHIIIFSAKVDIRELENEIQKNSKEGGNGQDKGKS
jgi:hypothetical protein